METIDRTITKDTPANFAKAFPDAPVSVPGAPKHVAEEIRQCQELYFDTQRRLRLQGVLPITVVNFNNFPVKPDGVIFRGLEIPGVPQTDDHKFKNDDYTSLDKLKDGTFYVRHVVRHVLFSISDKGGAMFIPREHVPMEQAAEFNRQFYDIGGVLAYYGDCRPDSDEATLRADETNIDDPATHEAMVERLKQVRTTQRRVTMHLVNEGNTEFNKPGREGVRNLNERHRRAALFAKGSGWLEKAPEWIVKEMDANTAVMKKCASCGNECKAEAVLCQYCNTYVFDPFIAYKEGMISDEHPALKRLSIAQCEELALPIEVSMEWKKKHPASKKESPKT